MKAYIVVALLLVGCSTTSTTPPTTVTDPTPTVTSQHQKDDAIGTATGKIVEANKANPNDSSRAAIQASADQILSWLRMAPASQVEDTVKRLVAERDQAISSYATLKAHSDESIAKLNVDIAQLKAKMAHDAYYAVVKGFLAFGLAVSAAGIGMILWSSYKIAGYKLVASGISLAGSGLLWGKPWFYLTVGIGVLLFGAVIGVKIVWAYLDKNGNGKIDLLEQKA